MVIGHQGGAGKLKENSFLSFFPDLEPEATILSSASYLLLEVGDGQ
jgi:hypothetical protein